MGLEILKRLGAGNTASDACKGLCCKSNVSYWKNRLLDIGALRLQTPGLIKYYTLTPYGSKLLTRSEGGRLERVVLEDHAVKFLVVEGERRRLDWVKLGSPANWEKLGVRVGCVRVVRTSRSVIIHPGRLKGFDVDELLVMAGRTVEWVRSILEGRFGMVLGEMVPLHKPVFSEAFNTEMSVQARCFSWKPLEFRGLIAEILIEARLFWGPSTKTVVGTCFSL